MSNVYRAPTKARRRLSELGTLVTLTLMVNVDDFKPKQIAAPAAIIRLSAAFLFTILTAIVLFEIFSIAIVGC